MKKLLFALLFLGMALRLVVFLQNRSLFLDEANLARNIIEKPIEQFFQPLDYEQHAPPLFLTIEKGSSKILGNTEYSLRLFPLIMSLVGLLFFLLLLLNRFEATTWLWFPLALLLFSTEMIRYATEAKQYIVDSSLGIVLFWLAVQLNPDFWNRKTAILWAVAGCVFIWLSMPVVFILAGIGLYYLYSFIEQKEYQKLWELGLVIISWLVSFGFFYWLILRPSLATDLLVDYHRTHFLPIVPQNAEEWTKAGKILLGLFRIPFGFTTLAYLSGIGLVIMGIYRLFQQNKGLLILLTCPILTCLLASGLGLYSLMPRLSLFLVPVLLLLVSFGISQLWNLNNQWIKYALFLIFVVLIVQKGGYEYFYKKLEIEELKPIMMEMNTKQLPGDFVYVHNEAVPAFLFYQHLHKNPIPFSKSKIYPAKWDERPGPLLRQDKAPGRIWLVFSHQISTHAQNMQKDNLKTIPEYYVLKATIETKGAVAHLFESNLKK